MVNRMKKHFTFVLIVLFLSCSKPFYGQRFANPVLIPTSQDPTSVFAVDLNGDGLLDLLYETEGVNSTPGSMQTLLAQPSGGYSPGPATTLPLWVGDCRSVDINKDGKQDLACIAYINACQSRIATLFGNGDGSFQSPIYSGLMTSNCLMTNFFPWLYTPADVNSDSLPDLMVADGYNYEFFVLLGDGKGHFSVSFTANPATVQYGFGGEMFVSDLNGDGNPDLFANWGSLVWVGKGNGTFTYKAGYGGGNCNLYDIESDGHPDAVCGPSMTILHGNADGSFNKTPVASQIFVGGAGALDYPSAIFDANGDGILDIVGESTDGLSVLLGQGNLKFATPVHYAVGNLGFDGAGSITSQIVDLNQDGMKDIVATGPSGIYISYGRKDGTYAAPPAYPVADLLGQITVGDFNGDGIPDIAATGDAGIEVSLGNGDGTFKPYVAQPNGAISFSQTDGSYMQIAHGDFRGNGKQDILAIGNTGSGGLDDLASYILFGNGDGTFSSPQVVDNLQGSWSSVDPGSIADFNNDGRDDIFYTNFVGDIGGRSSFHFYVALSNGDGTFSTMTTSLPIMTTGSGTTIPPFPAFADFNKDGKLDAAFAAGASALVLLGNGDGSFHANATILPIPPYQGATPAPLSVATGDFDGDGHPDFAVLAQTGGLVPSGSMGWTAPEAVYVFYGNGDGTFTTPVIASGFNEFYNTLYSGDLSASGRSDLILLNVGSGNSSITPGAGIEVVPGKPGRLFGQGVPYLSGPTAGGAFLADVNKDGYPDVLVSNTGFGPTEYSDTYSDSVTELMNLGPQTNTSLLPSRTALAGSSSSFAAGTGVTFTATVTGSSSGSSPTGTVYFTDQTGVAGTVPLIASGAGSATAVFTTSMIAIGSDTMGAMYSGDSTFAPSSATVALKASGLPDTVAFTVAPNPVATNIAAAFNVTVSNPAGSSAAVPAGYVEFLDGSTIVAGPTNLKQGSTFTYVGFSTIGKHLLSVRYSGDTIHVPNAASQTLTVLLTPTVFISTPPSVTTAQAISVAISVSGATGDPTPTGSVTVTASTSPGGSGYNLSPATLNNGNATVTIPAGALAVGTYWLNATYTPDAASSSVYLPISIQGDHISITAPPPPAFTIKGTAVTVSAGATNANTSTITVTPSGGFTGSVALSASITAGPSGAQYPPTLSFGSTNPVTIAGTSAGSAILTVLTTAPTTGSLAPPAVPGSRWYAVSSTALACVLLFGIRGIQRRWRNTLAMLMLLAVFAGGVLACGGGGSTGGGGGGGGGPSNPGTTAGTYTITVSGASGATSATGTVTLIVE